MASARFKKVPEAEGGRHRWSRKRTSIAEATQRTAVRFGKDFVNLAVAFWLLRGRTCEI
jgi:hypothetical protein